jgi:Superinfection immunity protein
MEPRKEHAVLIVVTLLYFLPTVIALSRGHLSALAIFLLNLFLGWTVLGWLIAFIWSCTGNTAANLYRAEGGVIGATGAMAPRRSNSLWLILIVIIVAIVLLDKPRNFRDVRSFDLNFPTGQGLRL